MKGVDVTIPLLQPLAVSMLMLIRPLSALELATSDSGAGCSSRKSSVERG